MHAHTQRSGHNRNYFVATSLHVYVCMCVCEYSVFVQVVMFQVLDHHTRRNAEEGRVVGALLGSVGSDGTVQLKNAFPMNHDDVMRRYLYHTYIYIYQQ